MSGGHRHRSSEAPPAVVPLSCPPALSEVCAELGLGRQPWPQALGLSFSSPGLGPGEAAYGKGGALNAKSRLRLSSSLAHAPEQEVSLGDTEGETDPEEVLG